MATNLKIAFPDIPFNAVSVISSETYSTDKPLANLITGSRSTYAELASELIGQHEIEFDLGSGVSQACDYLALVNANVLKKSGVDYVRLRGSEVSYQYPTSMLAICDPERDVTFDSANRVSQVTDQSGNSNHFTQSTDALKPFITRSDNKGNFALYSRTPSDSGWTKSSSTIPSNVEANYDDTLTAARVLATAATAVHGIVRTTTAYAGGIGVIGKSYVADFYLKYVNRQYVWVGEGGDSSWHGANIDVQNGTIQNTSNLTASSITSLGSGWYRVRLTFTRIATGSLGAYANLSSSGITTGSGGSFAAAGTEEFLFGGVNFREASWDSDDIITTAAPQIAGINGNRCLAFDGTNDYLESTTLGAALSGSDTPFTLIAVVNLALTKNYGTLFSLSSSSSTNPYHQIYHGTAAWGSYRQPDGGGASSLLSGTANTSLAVLSFVFNGTAMSAYKDGTVFINGSAHDVNTLTLTRAWIGGLKTGGSAATDFINGKIAFMAVASSALGTTDREAWEDYLMNRYTVAPIADIDLQNVTLTGARDKDYITTFTESAAYRYWIAQFDADETSKRPLSKLYFGKLFDFGRDPQLGAQVESKYHQDKGIHEKRSFSLNYKGISTSKRQDFEDKIGNKKDVNHVMLHTTTYDTPLLTTDLTSGEIKSAKFESNGAQQNDLSIKIDETY